MNDNKNLIISNLIWLISILDCIALTRSVNRFTSLGRKGNRAGLCSFTKSKKMEQ